MGPVGTLFGMIFGVSGVFLGRSGGRGDLCGVDGGSLLAGSLAHFPLPIPNET